MLKPKRKGGTQQIVRVKSNPAPIGGLNARDSLAAMPENDAITLDNFFPTPTTVNLRNGYANFTTGIAASVESLMVYNKATGSQLFAAAGTAIYDVTAGGAVGAALATGFANSRWQHVNFGTTGGQFLYAVNGADAPVLYNGTTAQQVTTVSVPIAITGVDASKFIHVNAYKNRLFFVEKDSFRIWYLPVNSVGGAAAQIDMSPLFKLGGYMMAMMTWTIDNAAGVNEYAVFISSLGEVVIYNGTDPSVANNWAILGTFHLGRPIGRRCFVKVGSDIIIISMDGFFPLSKALLTDRSQTQDAISNKILDLVSADTRNYNANFGWEACMYAVGDKLIVNVPRQAGKTQYQYVMNMISGAWCRFTNWNANCFAVMNDVLYFGGNLGTTANSAYVAKADIGFSDNGAFIFGEAKTAFQYFGVLGYEKHFKMVRPIIQTAGNPKIVMGMDVDFADSLPVGTPGFSGSSGTPWNTAAWNTFPWGDISQIKKDWQTVTAIGTSAAFHMRVVNNQSALTWLSIDYSYEVVRQLQA